MAGSLGRRATWSAFVLALTFAGLQFTSPAQTNPDTAESLTLERTESIPPDVARTLMVACSDCHSHETKWPWYSHVAPISWWTVGHVNQGRAELNFSIWGTYSPRVRATRLGAVCELAKNSEMPLRAYALAHAEARMSPHAIASLCAWTTSLRIN